MQKFFFDMKDGVPMRDKVGIDFKGNLEAIEHPRQPFHEQVPQASGEIIEHALILS